MADSQCQPPEIKNPQFFPGYTLTSALRGKEGRPRDSFQVTEPDREDAEAEPPLPAPAKGCLFKATALLMCSVMEWAQGPV